MQVSIHSAVPPSIFATPAKSGAAVAAEAVDGSGDPSIRKGIEFSNVTPRQLLAYINEQEAKGLLDPSEGDSMMDQISVGEWQNALDVPVNLRERLDGTMQFHLSRGDVLASWYAGLIDRLDTLEAQSMTVSAMA
jgi:hypothetical protein